MIRALLIILASFLILIVSGCANTVNKPTVQQHYLVVSANLQGNVDVAKFRYFVFVKYGASNTVWPDLSAPNQNNSVLSIASSAPTAVGVGIEDAPVGGAGYLTSNFFYDEYYEWSQLGATWAPFPTLKSTFNISGFTVVTSPNNIQFSIPLNTASTPIGISIVTTNNSNNSPDCLVLDYTSPYTAITNVVGNFTGVLSNASITTVAPLPPSAYITGWSASII